MIYSGRLGTVFLLQAPTSAVVAQDCEGVLLPHEGVVHVLRFRRQALASAVENAVAEPP